MDTGTGVSTSRLQGEMRTPIASSAMEAVAHCSRSNSLNNDVNVTFCKGFRAQQMEGIRVTDSYPQDLGEVRVCSYPSVAGGGRRGWVLMFTAGATRQLEAVLVRGSSCSHIPQQHRSSTHFGSHPIKSEPQCLNVPRVALKHLEAPQPKKAHQSGSFRA